MSDFNKYVKEQMKEPEFAAEYKALDNDNFKMRELTESLDRGEADIKAGRLHSSDDVWNSIGKQI